MAKCEICGQQQWTKIVDPKTGRFIPDGTWPDGGTKYKAAKHTCSGQQQIQADSEAIPKQNVGSSNSILLGLVQKVELYMETQSNVLESILEKVMEKAKANQVSTLTQGGNIDTLTKRVDGLYDLVELNAAVLQEIKKHFKISSFKTGTELHADAQLEDVEEMADTDDQTQLDSHSINHMRQDE